MPGPGSVGGGFGSPFDPSSVGSPRMGGFPRGTSPHPPSSAAQGGMQYGSYQGSAGSSNPQSGGSFDGSPFSGGQMYSQQPQTSQASWGGSGASGSAGGGGPIFQGQQQQSSFWQQQQSGPSPQSQYGHGGGGFGGGQMGQQSMMDQSMHSQQMTPTGAGGAYHPPPSPALSHPSPMAQPTTPLPPSSGMGQPPTPYDGSLQRPSSTTPGQQIPASQRIPGTVQASTPPQSYMIPTFLCRLAQEGLVEILSRFHDFLNSLKTWQPPPGIPNMSQASMDRKTKIQESARTIRHLMKRLRVIYDKIYMECPEDESSVDVMSLIPFHDLNLDGTPNTSSPSSSEDSSEYAYPFHNPQPAVGRDTLSDAHKAALKEHKELSEVLKERNKQLKVLIDHSRTLIWEVNTMLAMRKHCL